MDIKELLIIVVWCLQKYFMHSCIKCYSGHSFHKQSHVWSQPRIWILTSICCRPLFFILFSDMKLVFKRILKSGKLMVEVCSTMYMYILPSGVSSGRVTSSGGWWWGVPPSSIFQKSLILQLMSLHPYFCLEGCKFEGKFDINKVGFTYWLALWILFKWPWFQDDVYANRWLYTG